MQLSDRGTNQFLHQFNPKDEICYHSGQIYHLADLFQSGLGRSGTLDPKVINLTGWQLLAAVTFFILCCTSASEVSFIAGIIGLFEVQESELQFSKFLPSRSRLLLRENSYESNLFFLYAIKVFSQLRSCTFAPPN